LDEELRVINLLFEDLRKISKDQIGIDRDSFVKFCPIPVSNIKLK
jgi:hypothetical protein